MRLPFGKILIVGMWLVVVVVLVSVSLVESSWAPYLAALGVAITCATAIYGVGLRRQSLASVFFLWRRYGWGGLIYASAAIVLTIALDGRFLFTTGIGGPVNDWTKDLYYLSYLRYGFSHGTVPVSFLVVPQNVAGYPVPAHSISYWSNPEVATLSPSYLLLLVMSLGVFLKVNVALHLAIGAAGVWVLGSRLALRLTWRIALYVLLMLNPWLLEHLALGYSPDVTVCYVPLV